MEPEKVEKFRQLLQAIAAIEAQRDVLGDMTVDAALGPMRQQLAGLEQAEIRPPKIFEAERKLVTVMFADISGYTALAEKLDPEAIREIMRACFDHLVPILEKHDGTIEKFIGDEIYAIFGAPLAHEDDPERAVRSAIEMLDALALYNTTTNTNLGMHIGINTGLVVAGGIGSEEQQQYGVMGDTVNLAARLANAAHTGEIFVGESTYRLTASLFDYEALEPISVKGKSEPVRIFKVTRARPLAFRMGRRGIQGIETRMIGRTKEFASLQAWMNSAFADRRTTLVTVLGDAGVGKTRLLDAFIQWLERSSEPRLCFRSRCTQQGQGAANRLLRDLFAFHFSITESDPIEMVRKKLERGIARVMPDGGDAKAHFLGAWLGYDYGHSPLVESLDDDSEQLHNRASRYLEQFFTALSNDSPVVMLLDDFHWADGGSRKALEDLCRRQPGLPLIIICLARGELFDRQPNWGSNLLDSRCKQLDLLPLSETDARTLVVEILQKMTQVPPILTELLVSRAEGNPYYMEELVKMLIDQGAIFIEDEKWQIDLDRLAGLKVPDTLTAVLQARLDRLLPQQKRALQQASVVGRVFWDAVLAELGAGADTRLEELAGREFVLPQRQSAFAGTVEYIFKHALLREVTYETVLKRVRRTYHRLVGDWLAAMAESNSRTQEYAAIIGKHYDEADKKELAASWYGLAGKQAGRQFDQEAAVYWLSRALELAPAENIANRYELLKEREKAYHYAGLRDKQFSDLEALAGLSGIDRAGAAPPPFWTIEVLLRKAAYFEAVSDFPAAAGAASEALIRVNDIADEKLAASVLVRLGGALWRQGEYDAARERFLEGKERSIAAGAQAELAGNLRGLGATAYVKGENEEAVGFFEAALEISGNLGNRKGENISLINLGNIASAQGDYANAKKYYEEALDIAQEIGYRRGESGCLNNLGLVAKDQGDTLMAGKYYEATLEIRRQIGDRLGESWCLNNLGSLAGILGDFSKAKNYYENALQISREIGNRRGECIYLNNLGVTAMNQKEYKNARAYLDSSLEIARKIGYRQVEAEAMHDLGGLAHQEKDPDCAEKYFQQAHTLHDALEQPQHVVEDLAGLAGSALDRGEPQAAHKILSPVLEYFEVNASFEGAKHPYRVYLACGQVLLAVGARKQAKKILKSAHDRLVVLAKNLPDVRQQEQFWQVREYSSIRRLLLENAAFGPEAGHDLT